MTRLPSLGFTLVATFLAATLAARAGRAEDDLAALRKGLDSPDPSARQGAVWALAKLPAEEAFQALLQALGHRDPEVRLRVVMALGERKNPAAIAPLQAYGRSAQDETHRLYTSGALARLGVADAVADLTRALADARSFMRTNARSELAAIGSPAVPELIRTLAQGPEPARAAAGELLGRIQDPAAIDALLAATREESLRLVAVTALGELHSPQTYQRLDEIRRQDSDPHVRLAAALALRRTTKDDESLDLILTALGDPDAGMVAEAAAALAILKDPATLDPLLAALAKNLQTSDLQVRCALAHALGSLGHRRAVPALVEALRHTASDYACASIAQDLNQLTGKNVKWEETERWPEWTGGGAEENFAAIVTFWRDRFPKAVFSYPPIREVDGPKDRPRLHIPVPTETVPLYEYAYPPEFLERKLADPDPLVRTLAADLRDLRKPLLFKRERASTLSLDGGATGIPCDDYVVSGQE